MALLSTALRAAGLHLRAADPAAMKDLLLAVHARAAQASAAGSMSSRAEASACYQRPKLLPIVLRQLSS